MVSRGWRPGIPGQDGRHRGEELGAVRRQPQASHRTQTVLPGTSCRVAGGGRHRAQDVPSARRATPEPWRPHLAGQPHRSQGRAPEPPETHHPPRSRSESERGCRTEGGRRQRVSRYHQDKGWLLMIMLSRRVTVVNSAQPGRVCIINANIILGHTVVGNAGMGTARSYPPLFSRLHPVRWHPHGQFHDDCGCASMAAEGRSGAPPGPFW